MWHDATVTTDDVQRWLDAYIAAWTSYDEAAIIGLFTGDCMYRYDPFEEPLVGAAAIAADWLSNRDAPGSWEAEYRVFATDGPRAVGVGETRYPQEDRRYANTYLLEFADDGRCSSFTEWYFLERKAAG